MTGRHTSFRTIETRSVLPVRFLKGRDVTLHPAEAHRAPCGITGGK